MALNTNTVKITQRGNMKNILKSQAGVSIIQVLIAAAMTGGLALVITQLSKTQVKVQRSATNSLEINEMYNRYIAYPYNLL